MKVKLIVEGGDMKPGPTVSQQLGPMGINLGKVISDVNEATKGFKGMKVPVEIDVDPKTKDFTIQVFSPPVSEMIKKELNIEKGSGKPHGRAENGHTRRPLQDRTGPHPEKRSLAVSEHPHSCPCS